MATGVQLLPDGMFWEQIPNSIWPEGFKWASKCNRYEIFKTKQGQYRLVAFDHDPNDDFPQSEFWMRDFPTLQTAAHQAEGM